MQYLIAILFSCALLLYAYCIPTYLCCAMPHSSRAFCVSSLLVDFSIGIISPAQFEFGQVENWFTSYDRV